MSAYLDFRQRTAELKSIGAPVQELPGGKNVLILHEKFMNKSAVVIMSYEDSVYLSLVYNDISVKPGMEFLEGTTQRSLHKSYMDILRQCGQSGDCAFTTGQMAFRLDVMDPGIAITEYLGALLHIVQDLDVVIGQIYI